MNPHVRVLGTAQDGGLPQAGCVRPCCVRARRDARLRRRAACLGIVDPGAGAWMVDATPDFREQLELLGNRLDGIFLTHAHAGHYTGLWHLGREAMGARGVPVWAMPRMRAFLGKNAPWEALVRQGHIELKKMTHCVKAGRRVKVRPVRVKHRDEYSETVGFRIEGPRRAALWIPDVDRWGPWLLPLLADVDAAWIDATFFSAAELPGRDISKIPHPLVTDTLELLASLPALKRKTIRLMHFNHSNPVARPGSKEAELVRRAGFLAAKEGERYTL